jgi:hypothetical protein
LETLAVIWTSQDGVSWSKIAAAELGSDDPDDPTFWLSDVTVGGPGNRMSVGVGFLCPVHPCWSARAGSRRGVLIAVLAMVFAGTPFVNHAAEAAVPAGFEDIVVADVSGPTDID